MKGDINGICRLVFYRSGTVDVQSVGSLFQARLLNLKEVLELRFSLHIVTGLCCWLLVAGMASVSGAAPAAKAYRVSVLSLPLKDAPAGIARSVRELKYGDVVTILGVAHNARQSLQNRDNQEQTGGDSHPTWYKVSSEGVNGYVPGSSLVPEGRFGRHGAVAGNPDEELEAGRGFSESEDPDMASVKGASGTAQAGNADFAALDKIITERPTGDEQEKTREFRETGRLGEYKEVVIKQ